MHLPLSALYTLNQAGQDITSSAALATTLELTERETTCAV